jgi:hypothetical protein
MAEDITGRVEKNAATHGTVPQQSDWPQKTETGTSSVPGAQSDVPESANSEELAGSDEQGTFESDEIPYSTRPTYVRRTRKPRSALQTILELVTGGLAGMLAAYYLLAWYQGPSFDLPKLGLPWIERLTAAPAKPDSDAQNSDGKNSGGKKPSGEKPGPEKAKKAVDPSRTSPASSTAAQATSKEKQNAKSGPLTDAEKAKPTADKAR